MAAALVKQLTAYVDDETRAWLEKRAETDERSLSHATGRVLREARERDAKSTARAKRPKPANN